METSYFVERLGPRVTSQRRDFHLSVLFFIFHFLPTPVHITSTIIFLQPQKPTQKPQYFSHTFPIWVESSLLHLGHIKHPTSWGTLHICCLVTATEPRDLCHTVHTNHIHHTNHIIPDQPPRTNIQVKTPKTCNDPLMTSLHPLLLSPDSPWAPHWSRLIQTHISNLFHHLIITIPSSLTSLVSFTW